MHHSINVRFVLFSHCRDEHSETVLTSMQTIMELLLEESEDIHENLILTLLSVLGRDKKVHIPFLGDDFFLDKSVCFFNTKLNFGAILFRM